MNFEKRFVSPEAQVILITAEDILATSGEGSVDTDSTPDDTKVNLPKVEF
jgi:hypothetical protein